MSLETEQPRVAVVTGACGGIGRAIATTLADNGWKLVLADRDETTLAKLAKETPEGSDVITVDVSREDDVIKLLQHTLSRYSRVDGFVSNAGIAGHVQATTRYPTETFQQVMQVNAIGTFLCLKHGITAMQRTGRGSFVAVGSTSSIRGRANLSAYVTSKHAVLGLMRTAALEQVGTAVRVNAVLPGPTQTTMIDAINEMAAKQDTGAIQRAISTPYGTPQDVAETVAFLLSEKSRHMNGSALVVDGGSTLA